MYVHFFGYGGEHCAYQPVTSLEDLEGEVVRRGETLGLGSQVMVGPPLLPCLRGLLGSAPGYINPPPPSLYSNCLSRSVGARTATYTSPRYARCPRTPPHPRARRPQLSPVRRIFTARWCSCGTVRRSPSGARRTRCAPARPAPAWQRPPQTVQKSSLLCMGTQIMCMNISFSKLCTSLTMYKYTTKIKNKQYSHTFPGRTNWGGRK